MKAAIGSIEVMWNHVPSHKGVYANEKVDRLTRAGIDKELSLEQSDNETQDAPQQPRGVIVDLQSPISDGEESDEPLEINESSNDLKQSLQKSFSVLDKSIAEAGSLIWYQEGMDETPLVTCTPVPEEEDDGVLL